VRYKIDKSWSVELAGTNLTDKRYETAVGYDAPRRGIC
jgi:outer membrane cobalamin receptor